MQLFRILKKKKCHLQPKTITLYPRSPIAIGSIINSGSLFMDLQFVKLQWSFLRGINIDCQRFVDSWNYAYSSNNGRLWIPLLGIFRPVDCFACQTRISERNIIEYICYAHINAIVQILILMHIIHAEYYMMSTTLHVCLNSPIYSNGSLSDLYEKWIWKKMITIEDTRQMYKRKLQFSMLLVTLGSFSAFFSFNLLEFLRANH